MESITKQLVNIGHGMSKEIAADEPAVAKLLVELSSALDVQYERGNALEARCAALTAENAGLKSAVIERKNLSEEIRNAGRPPHADFWHQSIYMADKKVDDALNCTASTDAFLAEVRAQGAEECVRQLVTSDDDGFSDAPNICAMVAHQLRKGVQS